MSQIRYLLDENVTSVYRTELVKIETMLIVWKVGDCDKADIFRELSN